MDIRVTGAREAEAALLRLAAEAQSLDLSRVGDRVRAGLESASPRLTGTLSQSWDVGPAPGHVSIGSDLVYAAVQNYGGYHNIVGLHYVERTAELTTDDAGRLVSDEIDRLISRF